MADAPPTVPEAVRRLATHPFLELDVPPGFVRVGGDGFFVVVNPFPMAQVVQPTALRPETVAGAVEEARTIARRAGKSTLAWWVAPDDDDLVEPLEALGLRNMDTPGFEAVENSMVLLQPPVGDSVEDVEVREEREFHDFRQALEISLIAFEAPPAMREEVLAGAEERYAESQEPGNPNHGFVALLDGRIVGCATAAYGRAGINLFDGAVLPEARGRGVYRALTAARWRAALERGTPALTVQAGRLSKPIVERLGFAQVATARIFVDEFV